ncbi:MAG: sialidase family protein [Gemmatimonadota bacterium]
MRIRDLERRFVYHSPWYPGFTSWCGLWLMPDRAVMCSFTQATGPLAGRPQAPAEVRVRLDWPPPGADGRVREEYDMTGLDLENVHLRSDDGGRTWARTGSDHFRTCMNGATGEAEEALRDGSLLRGVWGPYLPYDGGPDTGYMERSGDGGSTWSAPIAICPDPGAAFWPKRIRRLADGRLLTGGGLIQRTPGADHRTAWSARTAPVLFTSADEGASWAGPIHLLPAAGHPGLELTEEFDWAELEDGDLLCMIRAAAGNHRAQVVLRRAGKGWEPGGLAATRLPHSGHPELLRLADGAVLHIATTGISVTGDRGATWEDLSLGDGYEALRRSPGVPYYPRSALLPDGHVLVVGHVGGDDGYGCADQSIVGLRFGLESD